MNNLKMKILPHKTEKTYAVLIEGFSNKQAAKEFCIKTTEIKDITFKCFLNQDNIKDKND